MRKLFVLAAAAVCLFFSGSVALSLKPVDYSDSLVVPFSKVEVKPQPISIPEAGYPEKAREAGIEGQTVVEALVDVDGSIADAKVYGSSGNSLLDQAAVAAAMEATFKPATQRGRPVQVWVSLPFRFRLDDGKKTDRMVSKRLFVRDDERWPRKAPGSYRDASLDSALAALARMLTDSIHGDSVPRLAVTPFEELNGSVGDTGIYMAEALEALLASSGRCRVVEREAVAQLLGVVAPTRTAVMDTAARRNLVRVFRLSGIVAGTITHMDGGTKIMARVVNPRSGLITRTGEVWVRPDPRPQNPPPMPPPHVPPTYPAPPPGVTRFEGENMKVLQVTAGTASHQALGGPGWAESWSGGNHLWWRNAKLGDRLELGFDVPTSGTYRLKLRLTKANDYGIEQCYLDGRKLGEPMDLYNGQSTEGNSHAVAATDPMDMGSHMLRQGQHKLEFRIVGINPKAVQSYMFGLDYVDLAAPGLDTRPWKTTATRIEGEDLVLENITAGTYEVQPHTFGSQWSGGRQSWWWGARPGDRLDLLLPVPPGRYRVTAQFCKSHDYGIVQLLIDGKNVGKPIDFYADRAIVSGPMDLGIHTFVPETHVLSAVVKGANPQMHLRGDDLSGGKLLHLFAVDYLDLERLDADAPGSAGSAAETYLDSVVATIPIGGGPGGAGVTLDGRFVYIPRGGCDSVSVVRTSDNSLVDVFALSGRPSVAVPSPDGLHMFISSSRGGTVSKVRISDNKVVGQATGLLHDPLEMAFVRTGEYLYATIFRAGENHVAVLRSSDCSLVDYVTVGHGPWGIVSTTDGRYCYVACHDSIYVLRTSDHKIEMTIPTHGWTDDIALSRAEDFLYVVSSSDTSMDAIRISDRQTVASVRFSDEPIGLAISPNGEYLYVSGFEPDYVTIVRTSDFCTEKQVRVGRGPSSSTGAFLPDGTALYVAVPSEGCVKVMGRSQDR